MEAQMEPWRSLKRDGFLNRSCKPLPLPFWTIKGLFVSVVIYGATSGLSAVLQSSLATRS